MKKRRLPGVVSWLFGKPLPVGSVAPDFCLPDETGRPVRLRDFQAKKNVVLVFYPGDDTPLCRRQLLEFSQSWELVQTHDAVVLAINPQSPESHQQFRCKYDFPFPLLVDAGQQVARLYHAHGPIVRRTVYLVGKSGIIRYACRGKPKPSDVLKYAE